MDTARLTELVKIKDKAKASKVDKKEFCDLWIQLVREEGLGEEAYRFLVDGFPFCGVEPFIECLRSSEDMQKTVIAFLHSAAFGKNSAVAFKCALHLLSCLIRDAETEYATCAVIMRELPRYAFTREKQMIKDIGKMFARYMFTVIYAKKELPSLSNYSLNDRDRDNFVLVVSHGLEDSKSLKYTDRERMGAELVTAWIKPETEAPVQPAAPAQTVVPVRTEVRPVSPVGTVATVRPDKPTEEEKPVEEPGWSGLYSRGMQYLRDAFSKVQREMLSLSAENKGLVTSRDALQAENQKRREEAERLKAQIVERDEMLFAKEKTEELLQAQVAGLKTELEQKEQEISDRIQMSQIVQKNTAQQSDQELKRLGSELSTYYRDIKESEGIPMTAELGEILLDQIKDVFAVLIKHGIRVDL